MRLLLDTHILVWWHERNPRLKKRSLQMIAETDEVYVSLISLWEIGIKISTKRFTLNVPSNAKRLLVSLLELKLDHVQEIMGLPWYRRDPFDRMLVAQARCENLHLVTDDKAILMYDMKRIEI